LNAALHLDARQRIRRAGRTIAHVSVEGAHLLAGKFAVEIGIELYFPGVTHAGSSRFPLPWPAIHLVTAVASDSAATFVRAPGVTSRFRSVWRGCRQFPGTTSLRPHTRAVSRGNARAARLWRVA